MSSQAQALVRSRIGYRGWESPFALPFQRDLASLGEKMIPYAFLPFDSLSMVQGGVVGAGATEYGATTQEDDCWITHLVASSINPASPAVTGNFTVQFYDSERQKLWTPQPMLFNNVLGTAQKAFYLRRLYLLPSQGELKCSVINLSAFDAAIQVVAWGLRRDTWKAA